MDRQNVTSSGYTFNGQNFTNETRTDSQGNNYTVAVPSTISTATLSTPTTLPVTQPQYNTSGQQSLASQAGAYVNGALTSAEQSLKAEQDALKASQTDVGRLLTDAGNKGTDIASQYNQQDATGQSVNSLAAKLRQLSARSNALSIDNLAKSQGEINKATGQNITQSAVTRNTADATRENLINQASIAMESAIVNADYQSAKSYADQMVDAKYDKLEADTKAALFNLENNKERFTAAEKKVAEATAARLKKEEKDLEEKKANEKAVSDLIVNASSQGAPQDIVNRAKNAKTASEAAIVLGQYAGNYWAIEKAKQDALKVRADRLATSGVTGVTGDTKAQLASLSKEAQSYINSIQRGETTRDAVFTKLGATKAALALKNEISVGLDLIAGGKTGTKIINATEAANFQNLLNTMGNIDITAYGQIDTPGGLIFDIRNPTTAAYIDQIVASLSLEKRELLKGSGAISDYESRTLANAASILGRKNISETAAKTALNDIKTIFEDKVKKYNEQVGLSPENDPNSPWNRARQSQESGLSSMAAKGHIDPNAPFGEVRFNIPTSTPIK